MIKEIVFMLGILYIFAYCCIYTSYLTYNTLNTLGIEAKYKKADMIGTPYNHYYVQSGDYNLFLNPFREYGEPMDAIPPNELKQWGKVFNPVSKEFVRVI